MHIADEQWQIAGERCGLRVSGGELRTSSGELYSHSPRTIARSGAWRRPLSCVILVLQVNHNAQLVNTALCGFATQNACMDLESRQALLDDTMAVLIS